MKRYSEDHEWVELDGDVATVGISSYAIEQLGDITFVELLELDAELNAGDSGAFIESVKAASDIYTPISGTVTEVNEELADKPELLNEDPSKNWILKLKINDKAEYEALMDENTYQDFIKTL
jgi:glycine cleavage system H protein